MSKGCKKTVKNVALSLRLTSVKYAGYTIMTTSRRRYITVISVAVVGLEVASLHFIVIHVSVALTSKIRTTTSAEREF